MNFAVALVPTTSFPLQHLNLERRVSATHPPIGAVERFFGAALQFA
jgi:hypothetical protein